MEGKFIYESKKLYYVKDLNWLIDIMFWSCKCRVYYNCLIRVNCVIVYCIFFLKNIYGYFFNRLYFVGLYGDFSFYYFYKCIFV